MYLMIMTNIRANLLEVEAEGGQFHHLEMLSISATVPKLLLSTDFSFSLYPFWLGLFWRLCICRSIFFLRYSLYSILAFTILSI